MLSSQLVGADHRAPAQTARARDYGAAVSTKTYRERLRVEGLTLAGCGLMACAVLLVAVDGSADQPGSSAAQFLAVLVVMTVLGLRSVRRAVRDAGPVGGAPGSGEPTPLWQLPVIVTGLTVALWAVAGGSGGLHVAGGCAIVGLVQALVLERAVAAAERRDGRRYVRVAGSRILRGSRLGYVA
jgi:hypothetical protein